MREAMWDIVILMLVLCITSAGRYYFEGGSGGYAAKYTDAGVYHD